MKNVFLILFLSVSSIGFAQTGKENDWVSLFDGKSFAGWRINEHPETFTIADGTIMVFGERAHMFYEGPVANHSFKNFELKIKIKTTPGSNSGIFIHTEFQDSGWPKKGYEIQVNNTHTDWRKTGSIYAVQDVKEAPARDDEWFTEQIIVRGKKITIIIDGKVINEYTEPNEGGRLTGGTFALQGHDPKSKVFYKEIMVRLLPD